MDQLDDPTLIKKVLGGDSAAFDVLAQRYRQDVIRVAKRYLSNKADAEDLAQEALIEAYLQLLTLKDPSRFSQWLRTIVRNRCISHLRNRPNHISYEELTLDSGIYISETMYSSAPDSDELLIQAEDQQTIRTAIERLSPKNRLDR